MWTTVLVPGTGRVQSLCPVSIPGIRVVSFVKNTITPVNIQEFLDFKMGKVMAEKKDDTTIHTYPFVSNKNFTSNCT